MNKLNKLTALVVSVMVSACAIGPDFLPVAPTNTQSWSAPLPHGGNRVALSDWWRAWDDQALVALIAQAQRENPTIAQAAARITQARATVRMQTAFDWFRAVWTEGKDPAPAEERLIESKFQTGWVDSVGARIRVAER